MGIKDITKDFFCIKAEQKGNDVLILRMEGRHYYEVEHRRLNPITNSVVSNMCTKWLKREIDIKKSLFEQINHSR